MKKLHRFLLIIALLLTLSTVSACGFSVSPSSAGRAEPNGGASDEKIVIHNMGHTLTFTQPPKRAVALNQHATEILLALGLQDSMAGTAYLDDAILPELKEAYAKIPVLSKEYPSKEVFMAAAPDFAYAGWKSAFTEKTLGTVEELASAGIPAYIQESSNTPSPTLEDVYQDLRNIGRIFRVENRAETLIDTMQREIDRTVKQVGTVEKPLKVFVYDSGEEKAFTAAGNYLSSLIALAGGRNIFSDSQKGWAEVSWEEVVHRSPDVIVIVDYGARTAEQKKRLLLAKKELASVPAIANQRFIVLPLSAAAEGIRAPHTLETLARGLHPQLF
ncbi:ABC transporter substrate-binding protein [Aneurinibacillus sp. BA2021]|nr:ABC transporter substrate-binding protein [Aneurinibacillus sp. BA2021]